LHKYPIFTIKNVKKRRTLSKKSHKKRQINFFWTQNCTYFVDVELLVLLVEVGFVVEVELLLLVEVEVGFVVGVEELVLVEVLVEVGFVVEVLQKIY
jgi:hypothetical protein